MHDGTQGRIALWLAMVYVALAADYDGTLALDGRVSEATVEGLRWLKDRGKRLILVTGRELPDLQRVFPEIGLFDVVVAENGALLFLPDEGELRPLGPAPPDALVEALKARNVSPLSVGRSIVATWSPHENTVLEVVHELGLEWQIIFNKGAVMCLPPGINKASGLAEALAHLKLSPLNVIAIGDAENDHAMLTACGYSVAVANALDSVKKGVDLVTAADHGAGVCELIHGWIDDAAFGTHVRRHGTSLGQSEGRPLHLFAGRHSVLIAGSSGAGKSRLATALIESILASDAQLVAIDPEGDYESIEGVTYLGSIERAPALDEAIALLEDPGTSLVLGLLGIDLPDRPAYLARLLGAVFELRARYGRPHWMLIDESHHFLPAEANASAATLPEALPGSIFIAAEPKALAESALRLVDVVIAAGAKADEVVEQISALLDRPVPRLPALPGDEEAWFWEMDEGPPIVMTVAEPRSEHQRHVRKYAKGTLGEDKSFFFRGPEEALNLRAQNLTTFVDLAEGVDDATWLHHLGQGDYSRWLRDAIGDEELADEIAAVERSADPDAKETRSLIRASIQRRYTAPVE